MKWLVVAERVESGRFEVEADTAFDAKLAVWQGEVAPASKEPDYREGRWRIRLVRPL